MGIFDFLKGAASAPDIADVMGDIALGVARGTPDSMVCSGYSIVEAWIRVWAGARGVSRAELDDVLGFDDEPTLRQALTTLEAALDGATSEDCEIRGANAVWLAPSITLEPNWEAAWGAAARRLDFGDPAAAAQTINDWVSENTNGLIRDIVSAAQLSPGTTLALANAIYFKAKWLHEFEKSQTKDCDFHGASGTTKVPTMYTNSAHQIARTPDFELLRRPYVGKGTELVIVLPREGNFDEVRKDLSYRAVRDALDAAASVPTMLWLPRFELDTSPQVDAVLQKAGVQAVYGTDADLSGLAGMPGELFVAETIHRARIEVDESGTEAAAVTFIPIARSAGPQPSFEPHQFRVDRPFLFFVIERSTQTPLFSGQVLDL